MTMASDLNISATPRLALLVAQENYLTGSGSARLRTPVAGALALAEALEECGFEVTLVGDEPGRADSMGISALLAALDDFVHRAETLADATVLFYFAGHGVAHGDDYFMLSEAATLQHFRSGGLDLSNVVRRLERHDGGFTIVIADACRDHPFPAETERLRRQLPVAGMERILQRRSMQLDRGLIAISAGDGDIVFDDVDGIGMSRFTAALIDELRVPGESAATLFLRAREAVAAATNRRQRPTVICFDGALDTILNTRGAAGAGIPAPHVSRPAQPATSTRWLSHHGPLVSVVPTGADVSTRRTGRLIRLSLARPSGWSLNPVSALIGPADRRQDLSSAFAELILPGLPPNVPIAEEREARQLVSTWLSMLALFQSQSLRDLTRLDEVWRYLCEVNNRPCQGTMLDDPVMACALMADRLSAIGATSLPEFQSLAGFLERGRDPDKAASNAIRQRVAMMAAMALREFQEPVFRQAMSPGNVMLEDVLRDPTIHIAIEHDGLAPPAVQGATGLWLGAIRAGADAITDRQPLMIAVTFVQGMASLPFQRSIADVI